MTEHREIPERVLMNDFIEGKMGYFILNKGQN